MRDSSNVISLNDLEKNQQEAFLRRHIGVSHEDQLSMLNVLGITSMDDLLKQVIPASIDESTESKLSLESSKDEMAALDELRMLAKKNTVLKSMIGQGYYSTITPPVILRNVFENPAWYTAYTPYQPEISQGRLEVLFHFQTLITELTGMDIANASLLDEATAAAEAMLLCKRMSASKSSVFIVSDACFPQTIEVVKTRASAIGIDVVVGDPEVECDQQDFFWCVIPISLKFWPNFSFSKQPCYCKREKSADGVCCGCIKFINAQITG